MIIRILFALCLLLLSGAISYYYLWRSPAVSTLSRPEISEVKKAAIAKRSEQKMNEAEQDRKDLETVNALDNSMK